MNVKNDTHKVYVITAGECDDYRIVAVYSDKEKAKRVLEIFSKSNPNEVYTIEEHDLDLDEQKFQWTYLKIGKDYSVIQLEREVTRNPIWTVDNPEYDINGNVMVYVNTWDTEKAISVAKQVAVRMFNRDETNKEEK